MIGEGLELERRGCCGTTMPTLRGGCRAGARARLARSTPTRASTRRCGGLPVPPGLGGAGLANCVVELTTLDRSSSGGFKWKLVRLSVGLALE